MLNSLRSFPQVSIWAGELTQMLFQSIMDLHITKTEISSFLEMEDPDEPHLSVHLYYYPTGMLHIGEEGEFSEQPYADVFCLSFSLELLNSMTNQKRLEFFEDEITDMVNALREVISNEKGYNYATTH